MSSLFRYLLSPERDYPFTGPGHEAYVMYWDYMREANPFAWHRR